MSTDAIDDDLNGSLPDDNVKLSLIVAMSTNRCIGIDNMLPWRLPADLQYFKKITSGKAIVMGRTTFDSLKRPLPNRTNIVLTRNPTWDGPIGTRVVHSLEAAIALAESIAICNFQDEALIIGGAEIYRQALPQVSRMYITEVDTHVDGDAFFPEWNADEWDRIAVDPHIDESTGLHYRFVVYDRKSAD
jgi:dihydrofolate reductase